MSDTHEELAQARWEDRHPVRVPEEDRRCGFCDHWRPEYLVRLPMFAGGRGFMAREAAPCACAETDAEILTGNNHGATWAFVEENGCCRAWRVAREVEDELRRDQ